MELHPSEPAAFLDRGCAEDAALRQDVDRLLSVEGKVQKEFQEGPPAGQAALAMTMTSTMVAIGTHLGPYEIQALLGAGGMGEVYRARDTRLNRTVAIKVIPPGWLPTRLAGRDLSMTPGPLRRSSMPTSALAARLGKGNLPVPRQNAICC